MTEEEAKTKWCPMVRCIESTVPVNRGMYGDDSHDPDGDNAQATTNCIGSACMMWRTERSDYAASDPDYPGAQKNGIMSIFTSYCGLAGKP